jgi:twitching motility protein PilT
MPRIDAFLQLGREQGCSDIHLTVGLPPLARMDGDLMPIKYRELSHEEIQMMVLEILDDLRREELGRDGSVDFSYASQDAGRFRINVCKQSRGTSVVCRVIPNKVIPLQQLGLPRVISGFTDLNAGLVLVTGATGTGKSTTLAAIIDEINAKRNVTIVTLEDPIEFVHDSKQALVVQREIGSHVPSFSEGLRSALRQDPDVILVGELRDHETIALALEAAETGHLVLGTLHTRGAAQTVDRILDAFPAEAHNQVCNTLADNLKLVLSQELVRAADGRGRRAAVEILVAMPAVAQLIREGKTFQIPQAIVTGRRHGMQLMDKALLALVEAGDVDADQACLLATDKRDFLPHVTRPEAIAAAQASAASAGVGVSSSSGSSSSGNSNAARKVGV